jgi:hypothetical protein
MLAFVVQRYLYTRYFKRIFVFVLALIFLVRYICMVIMVIFANN